MKPVFTTKFQKDIELCKARNYPIDELKTKISLILNGDKLPSKCNDHPLNGKYKGYRDCHIRPDWVLIYKLNKKENQVIFARTGTHADLF